MTNNQIRTNFCAQCKEFADRIEALEAENERLREELAEAYIKLSGKSTHASDCATSNAPAKDPGPCNCDAEGDTDLVAKPDPLFEVWKDMFPRGDCGNCVDVEMLRAAIEKRGGKIVWGEG